MIKLPDETEIKWRDLALQFDGHRMQAIGFLKMILNSLPDSEFQQAREFLKEGPLPGDEVLRNYIYAIAEFQRLKGLNATAQPKCQKCGDTGMADSGGVQPWGEQILIECDCATAQPVSDGCKVPEGWKLVPLIAFPSQWAAGQKAFDSAGINKVDAVYKAMVAAAPGGQDD